MPDRIALKRLTASDLTFFESLFRTLNAGNQKAINLNADVFIQQLYPALPNLVATLGDVIAVSLTLLGPNGAGAHVISRAVTKRDAYKNWRLNGEFVRDPEGQPGRFNLLKVGDLALMEFGGDPGPQRISLLLVAAGAAQDATLHAALNTLVPGTQRTMVKISREQVAAAAVAVPQAHPVWLIAADPEFEGALEDAALGGVKGTTVLRTRGYRKVSAATLAAAKASAEKNGRDGEALAWVHLTRLKAAGSLSAIEWTSQSNAVSSCDFQATDDSGIELRIDAKSTSGKFEWSIHMSAAELAAAAEGSRYDLWRIYGLDENGAQLRIAEAIGPKAKAILDGLKMPAGVTVDSVSINPSSLTWGPELTIELPDE